MALTTFTATDPNGTLHTRTSKTRTYTHTVVVQYSKQHALREAHSRELDVHHRRNHEYFAACAAGTHLHTQESWGKTFARNKADGEAHIAKYPTAQDFIDAVRADKLASIEARDWDEWHNVGWCGRPELARNRLGVEQARPSIKAAMMLEAVVATKAKKGGE